MIDYRNLGTHRRPGQPADPGRDELRRPGQPRPRRRHPDHPPGARRGHQRHRHRRRLLPRRVRGDRRARRCRAAATTCSWPPSSTARCGDDPNHRGNSRRWIIRAVEDSLRRLQTDHIDLYQVHRPDARTPTSTRPSARSSDLVRQGKIRYFGTSTFQPSRSSRRSGSPSARHRERPVTEQPPYSILARGVERDVLPVAQRLRPGRAPVEPARRRLALRPLPARRATRRRRPARPSASRRATTRAARPTGEAGGRRAAAAPGRRGRALADPPGARLRARAPGGHLGHHRAAHAGAPGVPARRRRR